MISKLFWRLATIAENPEHPVLEEFVQRAQAGDRQALEEVVKAIQNQVHSLALRFLWSPQEADDATQEILVRIITRLGTFQGKSAFRTWVYRVATNALLNMKPTTLERQSMSFDTFAADLSDGLADAALQSAPGVEESLLLEEIKIGCTHAMLHCLDRKQRIAFILGEILEMDQGEASEILQISPAAFRKRLSRARRSITDFMAANCGLFDPTNACRCRRRVPAAVRQGRVQPGKLHFAANAAQAQRFPEVLAEIRRLTELRRAAALYRSHSQSEIGANLATRLRLTLDSEYPV